MHRGAFSQFFPVQRHCPPSFWQNRRRRRMAARRQRTTTLLLAHPVLDSHLRPLWRIKIFWKNCRIAKNLNDRKQDNTKPFSCKYCEKSFVEIQEVKEHIKIHLSILETKDGAKSLSYDKDCNSNHYPNTIEVYKAGLV